MLKVEKEERSKESGARGKRKIKDCPSPGEQIINVKRLGNGAPRLKKRCQVCFSRGEKKESKQPRGEKKSPRRNPFVDFK